MAYLFFQERVDVQYSSRREPNQGWSCPSNDFLRSAIHLPDLLGERTVVVLA